MKIVGVDIDGILTNETEGHDYANRTVNEANKKVINSLYINNTIILFTSRDITDKTATIKWLEKNDIKYNDIIFNKPKFDFYIDDKNVGIDFLKLYLKE